MAFLFNKKRTPPELVKSCLKYLGFVQSGQANEGDMKKKATQKLTDNCSQIKWLLMGDTETEAKQEIQNKMAEAIFDSQLLVSFVQNLHFFEFEARKDVSSIFATLCRNYPEQTTSYVTLHRDIIDLLVNGYVESTIALTCGGMLRELIRHEDVCKLILAPPNLNQASNTTQPQVTPHLERFFGFVQLPVFDIASDAFSTLKLLLTKHKKYCAKFLEQNFTEFFTKYTQLLLLSDSYVTKRLGLKLLAELLLTRENFVIMMKFIEITDYLKITMSLLRGTTKTIQIEAFHVFKIFVANPRKSDPIKSILYRNRPKLIEFLNGFQKDRNDEQFHEEKSILLATLVNLEPPPGVEP